MHTLLVVLELLYPLFVAYAYTVDVSFIVNGPLYVEYAPLVPMRYCIVAPLVEHVIVTSFVLELNDMLGVDTVGVGL